MTAKPSMTQRKLQARREPADAVAHETDGEAVNVRNQFTDGSEGRLVATVALLTGQKSRAASSRLSRREMAVCSPRPTRGA